MNLGVRHMRFWDIQVKISVTNFVRLARYLKIAWSDLDDTNTLVGVGLYFGEPYACIVFAFLH